MGKGKGRNVFDLGKYGEETPVAAKVQPMDKQTIFQSTVSPQFDDNEDKTVRKDLRCRPTTVKKVEQYLEQEKAAGRRKASFNDLVNQLLERFLEEKGL